MLCMVDDDEALPLVDDVSLRGKRRVSFAGPDDEEASEEESEEENQPVNIGSKLKKRGGKKLPPKKKARGRSQVRAPKPESVKSKELADAFPAQQEIRRRPTKEDESMKDMLESQFSTWSLKDHLQTFALTRSLVYSDGSPFIVGW